MDAFIRDIFVKRGIEYVAASAFDAGLVTNPRLFDRSVSGFAKNMILFLVPYRVKDVKDRNISVYAAPRDYHVYMKDLFSKVIPELEALFPGSRFYGMSDHSPINETLAAGRAGLGVIGDNMRLINEKYGSYVFLGEIYTDAEISTDPASAPGDCLHCGACRKACPCDFGETCLSAVTQKRGALSDKEAELIKKNGSVWGCDICQDVCPMNENAVPTEIGFFKESLIYRLDEKALDRMSDEEFSERAFSWRGRAVIERNLRIAEGDRSSI